MNDFERRYFLKIATQRAAEGSNEDFEARVMRVFSRVEKMIKEGVNTRGVPQLKALNLLNSYRRSSSVNEKVEVLKKFGFDIKNESVLFKKLLINEADAAFFELIKHHCREVTEEAMKRIINAT
jgi:hypothetical protein